MAYAIRSSVNSDPTYDGDFGWYLHPDLTAAGADGRRILYVNGMNVQRASASQDALTLSGVIQGYVLGVYNERGTMAGMSFETLRRRLNSSAFFLANTVTVQVTQVMANAANAVNTGNGTVNGLIRDAAGFVNQTIDAATQTVTQVVNVASVMLAVLDSHAAQIPTLATFTPDIVQCAQDYKRCVELFLLDAQLGPLFRANPRFAREFARLYFMDNPAVLRLLEFLNDDQWGSQRLVLFCHSQGNLVAAGALFALRALRDPSPPRPTVVFAVASPAPNWPVNVDVRFYSDPLDVVPLLAPHSSYRRGTNLSVSRRPFPENHAISTYAAHTPLYDDLAREAGLTQASPAPQYRLDMHLARRL